MSVRKLSPVQAPLVDGLIAGILLIVLMATVAPRGLGSERDSREVTLLLDLHLLRAQIDTYAVQHDGRRPGEKGTADDFRQDLVQSSDRQGRHDGTSRPFGPYFVGLLPANPYTGGRGVRIVDDVDLAVSNETALEDGPHKEAVGWIYSPRQGRIKANATGPASDGRRLIDL